jgi:nitroimidazol reductase NimA-like FMN-containing flavoprotein (pyridoxamine 5'-phosphate oxidase superfamily)
VTEPPDAARDVLDRGVLCHVAAPDPSGPHVTPVVFTVEGGRVWGTTGRGTTKARRWRDDGRAAGLVRAADRWVTFRGPVTMYDLLDPSTWGHSLRRIREVTAASARFTVKNARFFAGYARDAARVPLAWTPPARVLFSVDLQAGAVGEGDRVLERWGTWGRRLEGLPSYRAATAPIPNGGLPEEVRSLLTESGPGTLAVEGRRGPVVLPARWTREDGSFLAVLPRRVLALAAPPTRGRAALVVEHASRWRAARMRGLLVRGEAATFLPDELRGGRRSLDAATRDVAVPDPAVVRLRAETVVWWQGWVSGTVGRP